MTKPDFIIIGAMKSATSTLHEQLAWQPGIFMSTPKEPNFFSDDAQYAKGWAWYEGLFAGAKTGDLCGESSTHYSKLPDYPETLARMQRHLPDVKLIYVIRHPVERLISHYIHQWSLNVIRCDINTAIDSYPELINYSCYAMQLKPYLKCYGPENILLLSNEAIRHTPQQQLERIARFIGYQHEVRWQAVLPEQNVSMQRIRRFAGYELLVNHPLLGWVRRTIVPQVLRDQVKKRLTMQHRPVIDVVRQRELEKTFDADLRELGRLINTSLTLENYTEVAKTLRAVFVIEQEI
ncbi:sulfotransferase domain-containing protein [Methylophaga sp. OBS4]|uniref:sulfotransferase domain-containing protein n=1 Tax=Methylophaga sp. OBS4 TaxID=2991935 RepID=UPI002259B008|nr:sulfotransferase domain-containing protein [Methylophaga sp. OBS4]MCX4188426.1 sulfotransferase domain-containing protein [Methylophaga sp. OBS4]